MISRQIFRSRLLIAEKIIAQHITKKTFLFIALLFVFIFPSCREADPSRVNSVSLSTKGVVDSYSRFQFLPSQPMGTIPGSFSVNGNGSATYLIPIEVPPGTNGVQPDLTLAYDHHLGDGYLGMGWSLNGISAITRCGSSNDISKRVITYTDNDTFCLDGIELKLVSGDHYGANGSVYRTAKDTWTKIIAHFDDQGKSCGGGPCSFTGLNKDGVYLSFGQNKNSGSRVLANGQDALATKDAVRIWSLDEFIDSNSNYTRITYYNDALTGEYYPTRIDYTGNMEMDMDPQRSVVFTYEKRPHIIKSYRSSSLSTISMRLRSIETFVDKIPVLQYNLKYESNPLYQKSLLSTLTLCDAKQVCLPPTVFDWSQEDSSLVSPNDDPDGIVASSWPCKGELSWSDFNGDGLSDLHCDEVSGDHYVLISNGTELVTPISKNPKGLIANNLPCIANGSSMLWSDFNGDGRKDYHCNDPLGGNFYVMLSSGTGLESPNDSPIGLIPNTWTCADSVNTPRISWNDFNGDGRSDLHCDHITGDGNHWVLLSNSKDLIPPSGNHSKGLFLSAAPCEGEDVEFSWADFNGDGLSDMHCDSKQSLGGNHCVLISNGKTVTPPPGTAVNGCGAKWECAGNGALLSRGDFNGDGMLDGFCHTSSSYDIHLSTGYSTVPFTSGQTSRVCSEGTDDAIPSWSDFNGDGNADMHCDYPEGSGNHYVYLSMGDGSMSYPPGTENTKGLVKKGWLCNTTGSKQGWIDFNGDGLSDIFCSDPKGGVHKVLIHNTPFPNLLVNIADGLGKKIAVDYKPLSDSTVYSSENIDEVSFPLRPIRGGPMYVVSNYAVHGDHQGHVYSYNYQYEGAKTEITTGKWLGFRTVKMTEEATGRSSQIVYHQDFPFIGLVKKSTALDQNQNLLGETHFTYQDIASAELQDQGIHQPMVNYKSMTHWSKGSIDYTVAKRFYYDDSFGNLTLIADYGEVNAGDDNVFTCFRYVNNTTNWNLGYPSEKLVTSKQSSCTNFVEGNFQWNSAVDLQWNKIHYDVNMNVILDVSWDDTFQQWAGKSFNDFDSYGNAQKEIDLPSQNETRYLFDATYNTFIREIETFPNKQLSLTSYVHSEPYFGNQIGLTDVNGNLFQSEIDGFGRVINNYGPDPHQQPVLIAQSMWRKDLEGKWYQGTFLRPKWGDQSISSWYGSRNYLDGLGRVYESQEHGAPGSKVIYKQFLFDNAGRLWRESLPYFQESSGAIDWITQEYDSYNRPSLVTEPDGIQTKIQYAMGSTPSNDQQRKIIRIENFGAPNPRTTIEYLDVRGNVRTRIAANSLRTTNYTYDPLSRLKSRHTEGLPQGKASYTYDSLSRIKTTNTADRGLTSWSYHQGNGQLKSVSDAAGNVVSYPSYDGLGRPLQRTLTTPKRTEHITFTYDESSHLNGLGELTSVSSTNPDIGPWSYAFAYNAYGNNTAVNFKLLGKSYSYASAINPDGSIHTETYPDGSKQLYAYQPDGNISSQSLQIGKDVMPYVTYGAFDAQGRFLSLKYKNGLNYSYAYYPDSQYTGKLHELKTHKDGAPVPMLHKTYQWNHLNQLTGITDNVPVLDTVKSETFGFNNQENVKNMGFLTSATSSDYGTKTYRYDQFGNRISEDGQKNTYYPGKNLIESSSQNAFNYSYYSNGNLKQVTKNVNHLIRTFSYDAQGKLIKVDQSPQEGTGPPEVSAFNFQGQRIYLKRLHEDAYTQYISPTYEITTLPSGARVHTKYIDSVLGRAVALTTNEAELPEEKITDTNALIEARFFSETKNSPPREKLSKLRPVVFFLFLLLLGWSGMRGTIYSSRISLNTRQYLSAILTLVLLLSTFQPEAMAQLTPGDNGFGYPVSGEKYFIHDQRQSTVLVTNDRGEATASISYLPFGEINQNASSGVDDFRPKFSGHEWGYGNELYLYGDRHYNPRIGSFTTPDPLQQYLSPYLFVGDSPEDHIDPGGDFAISATTAAIAAGALIGAYSGGAAVNHDYNPAHWDWKAGRTYAGLVGGSIVGGVAAKLGAIIAAEQSGTAAGIRGVMLIGAGENAAFTAMGGGSSKEVFYSALAGAGISGVFEIANHNFVGSVFRSFARRTATIGAESEEVLASTLYDEEVGIAFENCAPASFLTGTPILVGREQLETIENIGRNDNVIAYNKKLDKIGSYAVQNLYSRQVSELIEVVLDDGQEIYTTPEHPFWVEEKGWLPIAHIDAGDHLRTAENELIAISSIRAVETDHPVNVYNFSIEQARTYFVSKSKILVHNVLTKSCAKRYASGKRRRPSWMTGKKNNIKQKLFKRQRVKGTKYIRSAVSRKRYLPSYRIKIGKKNPRWVSGWHIDHAKAPWRALLWAAQRSKKKINEQQLREISNYLPNLRLLTAAENMSHRFEPSNGKARAEAIKILKKLGYW